MALTSATPAIHALLPVLPVCLLIMQLKVAFLVLIHAKPVLTQQQHVPVVSQDLYISAIVFQLALQLCFLN